MRLPAPLTSNGELRYCADGMLRHLLPPLVVFGEVGLLKTVVDEVVQAPVATEYVVAGVDQVADSKPSELYE